MTLIQLSFVLDVNMQTNTQAWYVPEAVLMLMISNMMLIGAGYYQYPDSSLLLVNIVAEKLDMLDMLDMLDILVIGYIGYWIYWLL